MKKRKITHGKQAKLPPPEKLELTDWDLETLVASWRYYEQRSTITSATFPADIIRRFFSTGSRYSDEARRCIAHQFAKTDHGLRGEADWDWKKKFPSMAIDRPPWCKFFRFCEGYVDGFPTLRWRKGGGYQVIAITEAFHCDATERWYPVEEYVRAPALEMYIPDEWILDVIPARKGGDA